MTSVISVSTFGRGRGINENTWNTNDDHAYQVSSICNLHQLSTSHGADSRKIFDPPLSKFKSTVPDVESPLLLPLCVQNWSKIARTVSKRSKNWHFQNLKFGLYLLNPYSATIMTMDFKHWHHKYYSRGDGTKGVGKFFKKREMRVQSQWRCSTRGNSGNCLS